MESFRHTCLWLLAATAICAVVVAAGASAQEPSALPPSPTPDPTIPSTDLAQRADDAAETVRRVRREIEQVGPEIEEAAARVRKLEEALEERRTNARRVLENAPNLEAIREIGREWDELGARLGAVRRSVSRWLRTSDHQAAEVAELLGLWTRTLREARGQKAPPQVIDTARGVISNLEAADQAAKQRHRELLTLEARVGTAEIAVSDALDRALVARDAARGRLLEPDPEPWWTTIAEGSEDEPGVTERLRQALQDEISAVEAFVQSRHRRLVVLIPLFFSLLFVTRSMRTRVRQWSDEDPSLGASAELFEHPVSMAIVVTLLAGPWMFPLAPPAVTDLAGVALLFPILRLLLPLGGPELRPILYAAATFYLIDRLRDLTQAVPQLSRWILVIELIAALLALARLLLVARSFPDSSRLAISGARCVAAIFTVCLVALATGYSAAAVFLADGALTAIYVALLLNVGLRVLRSAASILLNSRRARVLGSVRSRNATLRRGVDRVLTAAMIAAWAFAVLDQFTLLEWVENQVRWLLALPLTAGTLDVTLGDIAGFVLTVWVAFVLSRAVRLILEEDVFSRTQASRGTRTALSTLAHYAILVLGFFMAMGAAGVDWSRFTVLAGAFGVGIGFGLQNVVNNFVSGLILLLERPIQVGDVIEAGGLTGEVKSIGIRSSTLRTFQGAEVLVPNGDLIANQVINWTLSDSQRRIEIPVGVAYGTDPERVLALLTEVAESNSRVMVKPRPVALFIGFGASSLDFELRAWTSEYDTYLRLRSELAQAIYAALAEAEIEIPFPQRDVHLKTERV